MPYVLSSPVVFVTTISRALSKNRNKYCVTSHALLPVHYNTLGSKHEQSAIHTPGTKRRNLYTPVPFITPTNYNVHDKYNPNSYAINSGTRILMREKIFLERSSERYCPETFNVEQVNLRPVTGSLVLEKVVLGPKFSLKISVPWT